MTLESQSKPGIRKWVLIGGAAILSFGALGYAWYDYRFPSWKEEVLLPDGRKIIVKQRRDFIEGYGTRKTWLTFSLPEIGGEQTWVERMQPVLIATSRDGAVYVVGWPTGEKQLMRYEHPRFGYVAFRWNGSAFVRVPFMSVPEGIRGEENVVRCFPGREFLSWETKTSHGCNEYSEFLPGITRRIDVAQMQDWALRQAKRHNITPLSE